jgi:hypothetical protein
MLKSLAVSATLALCLTACPAGTPVAPVVETGLTDVEQGCVLLQALAGTRDPAIIVEACGIVSADAPLVVAFLNSVVLPAIAKNDALKKKGP